MPQARPVYARLAVVADLMTAQVIAAHLETEGIPARVSSESLGPYRLTVGNMATAEIWVPDKDLEEALGIMSESDNLAAPLNFETGDDRRSRGGGLRPVAALLFAVVLALVLYRIVTAVFQ